MRSVISKLIRPRPPVAWALTAGALGALALAVGLLYVPIPPNSDQESYDYMAWSALNQGGLYRNGGDVNMPGQPLLHIASLSAFGNHYWSYRMLDYLLLVGFAAAVAGLTREEFGGLFGASFFGLYLVLYTTSGYWMGGQPDVLATHAVLLGGLCYLRRSRGGGPVWPVVTGVTLAAAALLKPTYLAFAPLMLVADALSVRRGTAARAADALAVAGTCAVCLGAVVLAGWATDSLKSWYEMTLLFSSQNYVGGLEPLQSLKALVSYATRNWQWASVMAVAGAACWAFDRRRAVLVTAAAVLVTVLVSLEVQRKGFFYHFGGLLALFGLLCSYYLTEVVRLSRRLPDRGMRFTLVSFPVLLVVAGLLSKASREFGPQLGWYLGRTTLTEVLRSCQFDDVVESSRYLGSSTRPGDTVWSYTRHVMINSLANRPMPTRLSCFCMLRSKEGSSLEESWRGEVERVFEDRPPEMIVVEDGARPGEYLYMADCRPGEPIAAFKEALDRSYALERRVGRFFCFRRVRGAVATRLAGGGPPAGRPGPRKPAD